MKTLDTYVKELHDTFDETSRLLTEDLEPLSQFNLTPQQENYLMFCVKYAPLTARELVHEFQVSKSAVSQVIARLEKDRFIEREQNPENKRETLIYLGPKGRMFARRIKDFNEKMTEQYYTHLSISEIEAVINSLRKLNDVIKQKQVEK
ncbi:MarR family winged helix-turn-helix transcriptional regulator [Jeotgalibacillus haloalkalitolerans]|uniref:MarR family transcriptional regulator n=1 Tax=Jeotgalibacillus haloalkalitolerans TaxID=3104292 RepID=A0ABU5KKP4_9BACL|nr:MarR family transcriptional regulator [Jeotgalibacillus sp. HH7-29]MDZ5711837.1 MarR family transcriptional regulator [Jeotgalibacillus sp. HH7-29]